MSETGGRPPDPDPARGGRALDLLLVPVRILVAAVVILDELLRPLYRPVIRWFAALGLIRRMEAVIARMPPYAVLGVLAVPFIGVEPLKILALFWISQGRFVTGLLLLAAAYLGSFLLVERIYDAGEHQLMRIGWFARVMGFVGRIRSAVFTWARSTRAYAAARAAVQRVRTWRTALLARFHRWRGAPD